MDTRQSPGHAGRFISSRYPYPLPNGKNGHLAFLGEQNKGQEKDENPRPVSKQTSVSTSTNGSWVPREGAIVCKCRTWIQGLGHSEQRKEQGVAGLTHIHIHQVLQSSPSDSAYVSLGSPSLFIIFLSLLKLSHQGSLAPLATLEQRGRWLARSKLSLGSYERSPLRQTPSSGSSFRQRINPR